MVLILLPRESVREPVITLPASVVTSTTLLTVNAYPWAEVILDGTFLGYTPRVEPFEVPAGRHSLILRNPHLGERKINLDLRADQPEAVLVDLLEEGR